MGYIGSQPATNFETVRKQVSTTNSGTTITLDYSVSSVQDILVTVNAVVQSYDNYSVSGTTLTLGGTLNNDRVEILYVGRTFQTVNPATGTVNLDMLSATGTKDATTFLRGDNTFATASLTGVTTGSGNVTISNGNLVLGTSGKGIDFSATSGTGTSEILADYEEGTFTPTWLSQGGSVTGSSGVTGSYIKIGKQVTVNATGILTTNSASTNYKFSNAPFQANGNFTGVGHEYGQTGTSQLVWIDDNSSQINLKKYDGAMIQNPYLRLTITYFTD